MTESERVTGAAGNRHHWAVFAAAVAVVVVGLLLWLAAGVLLTIFTGILLAVFLSGLRDVVVRYTRLPRGLALAVVCLGLVAAFGLLGWLMAARLAEQAHQFSRELPEAVKHLREQLQDYPWGSWAAEELREVRSSAEEGEKALSRAAGAASAALNGVTTTVVILFLALFLAFDPDLYKRSLVRLVPIDRRDHALEVIESATGALWRWTLARLLSMAAVCVGATVGFWIIGLPLALMLGVFAGLMNFIPNLGPLIWLAPTVLLALTQGPVEALYVGIVFLVVQTTEGYVITPLVQQRMVNLSPAVALSVQVIFGALWGFAGLALATPITAMGLVIVRKVYIEGVLGDAGGEG
ncbi:MAG TPA: AI-2E family transporter [Pirellulales bacterium]|jgi:predicted PurR-regulated permease PerM|nr:AI-2E family transporter [Pirellulales bacterium]